MHGIEEGLLDKGCAEASDLLYLHHHFALVFRLVCTKFPVTVYKLPLCCTYLLAI